MDNQNLAVPFIKFTDEEGFQITQEAIEFLENLNSEKLGIISIVGKYRTGKSYFVNKVLLQTQKNKGFKVGPTINPCTKGIWLWKKVLQIKTENEENLDVIIMDTEGFGGIDEDANHDTRIFLFSILLSSFFIYNSLGAINENALNSLALIVNLAKDIKIKNKGSQSEQDIKQNFPSFLWVIRDFMLSLETQNGQKLSSKQYLEKALEEQRGISDQIQAKNKIRKMIKYFFQERDCMTFVRPVETENDLKRLETIDQSYLRPEFVKQIDNARSKIFRKVIAKKIGNNYTNGSALVEITKAYIQVVNSGKVPNIESAWTYVCKESVMKAIRNCMKQCNKIIEETDNQNSVFEDEVQFQNIVIKKLQKIYQSQIIGDKTEQKSGFEKLKEDIKKKINQFKEMQNQYLRKQIEKQFDDKYFKIKERIISRNIINIKDAKQELELLKQDLMQGKQNQQKLKIIDKLILQKENEILSLFLNIQKKEEEQKKEQERELKLQMEMLNKDKENMDYKYQKAEEELQNAKEKIQQLKQKKKDLQLQNKELQINLQQKNYEYEQIKKDFEEYKQKNNQKIEKKQNKEFIEIQNQNEKLNKKLINTEKDYLNLKQQNDLQQKQLQHQEKLNKDLSQQLLQIKKKYDDDQFEFEKVKNISPLDITNMRQQLAQYEKQIFEYRIKQTTLEDQVQIEKNKAEEIKNLYDKFLTSFNPLNKPKEQPNNDLLETNKNLSNMLNKSHSKIKNLEEQVEYYKKFKKIIKNSKSVQCGFCFEEILSTEFMIHIDQCKQQQSIIDPQTSYIYQNRSQFNNTDYQQHSYQKMQSNLSAPGITNKNLHVKIEKTTINSYNSRQMDYVVEVYDKNHSWTVNKRYKDFCNLYVILQKEFPLIPMPKSSSIVTTFYQNIDQMIKKRFLIDERKKALEQFINDLLDIQQFANCVILREFLEQEKNCPQKEENIPKKQMLSQTSTSKKLKNKKKLKSNKKLKESRLSNLVYPDDENELIFNLNQIKANSKLLSNRKNYQNNQFFNVQFQMKYFIYFMFFSTQIICYDSILDNKEIESLEDDEIPQTQDDNQNEDELIEGDQQQSQSDMSEQEEEAIENPNFILSYYNPDIEEIPEELTEQYLTKNITDYHNHLKHCLDSHFTRSAEFQIPMDEIVEDCIGEKSSHLNRYYNDIKFLIKKFFLDQVKEILIKYGKGVFIEGVEYFRAIQLFTELNYDIRTTVKVNLDKILEIVSIDKAQIFKEVILNSISLYEQLLDAIKTQKKLLLHYVKVKREQYEQDYPIVEEEEEENEDEQNEDGENDDAL